jgi:hypothetical protein
MLIVAAGETSEFFASLLIGRRWPSRTDCATSGQCGLGLLILF